MRRPDVANVTGLRGIAPELVGMLATMAGHQATAPAARPSRHAAISEGDERRQESVNALGQHRGQHRGQHPQRAVKPLALLGVPSS
eukprot:9471373-Pyramimonas_sp.AAC.2